MTDAATEAVRKAFALHQKGDLDGAERQYGEILQAHPGFAEAWHLAGALALQQGNVETAVQRLGKAVTRDKKNAQYRYNYSLALRAAGRLADAATQLRRAHALDADAFDVLNNLGLIEKERGRLDAAEEALRKAIAVAPTNAAGYNNLALVLSARGDRTEAEAMLGRATALEPAYAEAHNNLGTLLLKQSREDAAEASFRRALSARPDYESALFNLAGMLHSSGRQEEAADQYRKLLTAAPDHGIARHLLNAIEGTAADSAPAAYVAHLFDGYADHFEDHLVGTLGYDAPAIMRQVWDEMGSTLSEGSTVVDLGCGTGLCGRAFREVATTLVGVDLSGRMVNQARATGLYDRVVQSDAAAFLNQLDSPVDLVIAGDLLIYVGRPTTLLSALGQALKPGGVFLCSIEETDQPGHVLRETGRFAHNLGDLLSDADTAGLSSLHHRPCAIRIGTDGQPIGGQVIALTRKGNGT